MLYGVMLNSTHSLTHSLTAYVDWRCLQVVIVPELYLVLFRPRTASVQSGLGTFFVPDPEHVIRHTKSWCVAHGEGGE